jgi:hypothetical protein
MSVAPYGAMLLNRPAVLMLCAMQAPAFAFTLESPIGKPCHERITGEAVRRVRARFALTASPLSSQEQLLLQDVPFNVDEDLRDLDGLTVLIGVRDPDLKGLDPTNLQQLATVHGYPEGQREHCLRGSDDDEPGGSLPALDACRQFIRESALYAVEQGLDDGGTPDPTVRSRADVYLIPGGPAHPELPRFWFYAGQALHATQDSYAHTFRAKDARIDTLLNWIDFANDDFDERRDGPAHQSELDECEGSDSADQRRERATDASEALLAAMLTPGDLATKTAAIDAALDGHLVLDNTCNADNRWCDAPDRPVPGCSSSGTSLCLVALALVLLRLGRRGGALAPFAVGAVLLARPAAAEPPACIPGQQVSCACLGGTSGVQRCADGGAGFEACECAPPAPAATVQLPADLPEALGKPSRFGLYVSTSVSIDNTAFVANLAGRYHLTDVWVLGLGADWNPWFSVVTRRAQAGTLDLYASVIRRWPINERFAARTSAHLGASVPLFNLYGAPAGDVGLYAAFDFIGLEARISKNVTVIIDPCEVAMPVPHLTGVPITYRQYRMTIGVQFGG